MQTSKGVHHFFFILQQAWSGVSYVIHHLVIFTVFIVHLIRAKHCLVDWSIDD